jgi:hypothetical protein
MIHIKRHLVTFLVRIAKVTNSFFDAISGDSIQMKFEEAVKFEWALKYWKI